MRRVLLLATTTGYQTRAFEDAAAHLGVGLVYATDRCHTLEDPWQDQAIPIRFHEAAASERLRSLLESREVRAERHEAHGAAVVEGFVPGREYALEGVLQEGVLHVLAVFDKPDPLDGPFFEETIYVTPSSASDREQSE